MIWSLSWAIAAILLAEPVLETARCGTLQGTIAMCGLLLGCCILATKRP